MAKARGKRKNEDDPGVRQQKLPLVWEEASDGASDRAQAPGDDSDVLKGEDVTAARRHFIATGDFPMRLGGRLVSPTIAYETWGELNPDRSNAILIFTGLSPSAHAASSRNDPTPGWWEEIIGPGKPIDTRRFFVICVNSLGSCFGSTGPASVDPKTGELYRLKFPVLSLEDVARAVSPDAGVLGPQLRNRRRARGHRPWLLRRHL